MKTSSKRALQAFGGITGFFVLAGGALLLVTTLAFLGLGSRVREIGGPYATLFFSLYSGVNVVFLAMLAISTMRLCRADWRGVGLLTVTLRLELVYYVAALALIWFLPGFLGKGAAAAWGVGNAGVSPQIFIAYPITGLFALWLLRRRGIVDGKPDGGPAASGDNSECTGGPPSVS